MHAHHSLAFDNSAPPYNDRDHSFHFCSEIDESLLKKMNVKFSHYAMKNYYKNTPEKTCYGNLRILLPTINMNTQIFPVPQHASLRRNFYPYQNFLF